MDSFQELYAISDLHLGGTPGRQIFDQGELLAKTIRLLASRADQNRKIGLVINGDIVDFLAEENASYFDPKNAMGKLKRILVKDEAFKMVLPALKDFVSTRECQLVLLLGNHDLELALPAVRASLMEMLAPSPDARGRVQMVFDGTGYTCRVGEHKVFLVHGNEEDDWNVVEHEQLRQVSCALNMGIKPPHLEANGGTTLVIDVLNKVKLRYPFVELLKPETRPVIAILLSLDPSQIKKIGPAAHAYYKKSRAMLKRRGLLSEEEGEVPDLSEEQLLTDLLAQELKAQAKTADELLAEAQRRFFSGQRAIEDEAHGDKDTLGFSAWWQGNLRKTLGRWLNEDHTFDIHSSDSLHQVLDGQLGEDIDFIVTGHTHLHRALPRSGGIAYFNAGTWTRLIELQQEVLSSDEAFAPIYKALSQQSLTALDAMPGLIRREPTVASLSVGP
jgi:UDP-2,3-diacylglucosamine pyrophosphatase LpxH